MPWITSADHGDPLLVHSPTVDLRNGYDDDISETASRKRRNGKEGFMDLFKTKKRRGRRKTRTERIRTRIPMLMTAYTYAKLRAMGSLEALNSATESVPIKMAMLRYETHARVTR
jgi:hypothetical protein